MSKVFNILSKKEIKNQRGFTLVEMLIALAVFSMIMAAVYGVMSTGLKARERHNVELQQNARAGLEAISAHLRSAFVTPETQSYPFNGNPTFVGFYILPPGARGPRRVEYYVGSGKDCSGLCRKIFTDPFNTDAAPPPEEPVAAWLSSMEFSYFDGKDWLQSWNAPDVLPKSVRIKTVFTSADSSGAFETEVNLPLSSYAEKNGGDNSAE